MPSKSGVGTIAGRALLFASSRPAYICRRCWRQTLDTAFKPNPSLQASLITWRCASSSSLPDRLRKRIWGTDKPPGAEDPYGPPGAFELKRKERETEDRDEGTVQAETRPPQTLRQRIEEESQEGLEDPPEASEATTWEGMPVLGRPDWGKEEWDEEHPFEGYMANPRAETREDLLSTIHRALVEVTTLQLAGLPLEIARNATSPTNVDRHRIAKGARFEATTNGRTFLVLEHEELRQAILDYLQPKKIPIQEDAVEEEDQLDTTPLEEAPEKKWMQATRVDDTMETEGLDTTSHEVEVSEDALEEQFQDEVLDDPSAYSPVDESWSQTSLADPELKFALLKRVMQLTGRRVPDPDINIIRDCKSLLAYLVKKPKPKKLVEALFANEAVDLPNVEIRERRYTPIDREKEIGRWKVIEQELEKRGLPVTGKGFVAVGDPIA